MAGRVLAAVRLLRHQSSRRAFSVGESGANPLQICVVGSGPAGFYTAEKLLKRFRQAKVDIVDRLPSPFGLVRSGVAPDHPETKVVINQFTRVANSENCSYFGNVKLDEDITLTALRALYHVVVLAYGAESDRSLGIPGEGLSGVHSAREVVWWYNGHPDCVNLPLDLKSTDTAVILGQGNVALDVARILLRPVSELATTDISEHAIAALHESNIRKVYLVGRRGPVQAACTAKELREILGIQGLEVKVQQADLATTKLDHDEMKKSRSHKRVYELFCKAAASSATSSPLVSSVRQLQFVFYRSPAEILAAGSSTVTGIRLEKTTLSGDERSGQRAVGTGEFEELECGLVLKSIGYKSLPVRDLPFDHRKGVVPNVQGRVITSTESAAIEPGLYVVGWLKRGPTGIIGTNLICADETVESIVEDTQRGLIDVQSTSMMGGLGLKGLLEAQSAQFVSFKEWQIIDQKELELGQVKGKPREKIVVIQDMIKIAKDLVL
ncbi:ferredoxin/flavodoxin---NADP+ reductase [Marchantia polymorpha subsp. ruderalis]|uniref:NADPH:adrenodoxin oxidoreductase, mitochondrial n=2 Tax=Marchantia polymorpha TaxID=3197 RepID=A0AAF6B7A1_MARPO|nr:hypothetical protein MARPO_0125s0046 [Marchantia polymorpha]BBN07885.1 hypothetical protein Mp_4g07010 [Marchantia polymorpha subsp. ruderalis]|eukprot:PTQ30419.1 hypothetical protein MARPO_0125s0046 [Marchantia polymorpha]